MSLKDEDGSPVFGADWSVIYQVYPRSFRDSDGDGIGDLPGLRAGLPALVELGVSAIWLSPFYSSPQRDGGYDVADYCSVDPVFGTLDDLDELISDAHRAGLNVLIDLVPNHVSTDHQWFRDALAGGPSSTAANRFHFRRGTGGRAPNNWQSEFGGGAWSRVSELDDSWSEEWWYLHLFDRTQADLNWASAEVRADFLGVLDFWIVRGVDGFRIDVAHGLVKDEDYPDADLTDDSPFADRPYWRQPGSFRIFEGWRRHVEQRRPEVLFVAEAWVSPPTELARWVAPGRLHQAFNFDFLDTGWNAREVRKAVDESIAAMAAVGAAPTWVLSNHDVVRPRTRLGASHPLRPGRGLQPAEIAAIDPIRGERLARVAAAVVMALPGSVYLYQGEELGLPEAEIADAARRDPTFWRSEGRIVGRDGSRVPLPWTASAPAFGFSPSGASWLPQPRTWSDFARDRQVDDPGSFLSLYTAAIHHRRAHGLDRAELRWNSSADGVLDFCIADLRVVANLGEVVWVGDGGGECVLTSSGLVFENQLAPGEAAWFAQSRDS